VVGLVYRSIANPHPRYVGGRKKIWSVQNRDVNTWYGRSRLFGSFKPWVKKAADKGAEDQVTHYFHRYGYGGDVMRVPNQPIVTADGQKIDPLVVAMDIMDKLASGASIALRSVFDPNNGQPLWDLYTREIPGSSENVLAWIDHLDEKILRGMGVTNELIEQPASGSFAGRRVAESSFHGMLTQIFMDLVMDFDVQVLRPLVAGNYKVRPRYNLYPMGMIQRYDLNQAFGSMSGNDQMNPEEVDSTPLQRNQSVREDGQAENV
jgi:hypothetical protein